MDAAEGASLRACEGASTRGEACEVGATGCEPGPDIVAPEKTSRPPKRPSTREEELG